MNKEILNKFALFLDISKGDILLGGRFKNVRKKVKELGTDKLGQPTWNGKKLLAVRIEKTMPKDKQSSVTQAEMKKESSIMYNQVKSNAFIDEFQKIATTRGMVFKAMMSKNLPSPLKRTIMLALNKKKSMSEVLKLNTVDRKKIKNWITDAKSYPKK